MEMRKKDHNFYRHQIEAELDKDASGQDVLDLLFGHYNNDYQSDYRVIRRYHYSPKTFTQRLNTVWGIPLTLVCAPFQYLFLGEMGWSETGRVGGFILRVCGERRS